MDNLDYKILATGSSGNAVRIRNIMIDCGISFNIMKPELYKVDTLLITHDHTDHLKQATLNKIRLYFPKIKIYGNYHTAYRHSVDYILTELPVTLSDGTVITPFEGEHDIPVTGFSIKFSDGIHCFYATDTCKVINPTDENFDYIFCEANYDKEILAAIGERYKKGSYDPILSAQRHLSVQACKGFYFQNARNRDSKLIELHQSKRFR